MTSQRIDTVIGPAVVLHRLALALECLDAVADRPISHQLIATVELPTIGTPPIGRPLTRVGPGRFTLLHPQRLLPSRVIIRVDDPTRQYVPRRIGVHPWTLAQVAEPAPYVPVRSRVVRLRLWPGSAHHPPPTTTTIRGRVLRDGAPARWCRVLATGPTAAEAGRAHTDERGEFVLTVHDTGQNPVADTVSVDLTVIAVRVPPPVDPHGRCADLPVEDIPQSSNPPLPSDLDNAVLRGIAVPDGFAPNNHPARTVVVQVGTENNLSADPLVFAPQP